jgi:tight adherence protein C
MPPQLQALLSGDALYVALLVLVFAAVMAMVMGVRYLFASRVDVVAQRMRRSVAVTPSSVPPTMEAPASTASLLDAALKPFTKVAGPRDEEDVSELRLRLGYAGYRSERALALYVISKILLALVLAGGFLWFNAVNPQPVRLAAFYVVLAIGIGFYFPNFWLANRISERQTAVARGMPDALDLLVTCVEAGLGVDLALHRVSNEIGLSAPLLAEELTLTGLEMRAGVARGEAFRRLARRTGVEDVKALASIVIQTEIFGTSIAKSLRIMADSMRVKRMQRAEERAAMVAVKMTMPLILNIMPALFVVLMGPAAVRIIRMLLPGLGGEAVGE